MTEIALDVRDLTVVYPNGHRALDGVSLTVPSGGRLGVVGPSGCGKTTLVRALLGLLPPGTRVSGTLSVAGHDLARLGPRAARDHRGTLVGYVAQDPFAACDPLRRVRHHVAEAWTAHGRTPPASAVVGGLTAMGIDDAENRVRQYPHQWSGGMLQRATTLAATAHEPALTLADEPTSALDAELADAALHLLRRTSRTLLLVSHDLALVARHTEDVVVLDKGRVVERGEAAAVFTTPAHERTAALVRASSPLPHAGRPVSGSPIATLRGAAKAYRGVTALADTDLELRAGEVTGIVGRSGSGKSTLLRIASAQERPDTGEVLLDGAPAWPDSRSRYATLPRRGWVMPVFQDPVGSLDRRWPLWRTITEPLVAGGTRLGRAERRERARAELDRVGLEHVGLDSRPGALSVGQCQRVAVLRALIAGPALVVADEPTASLDVHAAAAVAELLRAAADNGAAVLAVSHDEPRLASYADRVLRMVKGSVER